MAQAKDGSTTQVSCRIPKEVADAIKVEAEKREWSISQTVAKILKQWAEKK